MSSTRAIVAFALALLLSPQLVMAQQWKLVWSDEFEKAGAPDAAKWDYEEGFIRNNEAQYYTRDRRENARVENGMLVIEARKERFTNPRYNSEAARGPASRQFAEYTSASLITRNKADWKFVRIEVRAKLPQGRGVWPAIWTLGTSGRWPVGGEIDIMEYFGYIPNRVEANIHFSKGGRHAAAGGKLVVERPFDDFHIYAVEWFPDRLDLYFDQQKYYSFPLSEADDNNDNPFRKPHYLLINLALGGSAGGEIDDSILPQKYLIDYVRVYQQQEAPPAK
jgi:beta-glucanase (GH16 family)